MAHGADLLMGLKTVRVLMRSARMCHLVTQITVAEKPLLLTTSWRLAMAEFAFPNTKHTGDFAMSFSSVTGGHVARVALLLALVFSTSAAHAGNIFFSGGSHPLDSARLAAVGHTSTVFSDTDAGWAGVLSGANGSFDAILVGENIYRSLSPATKSSIASYVTGGGRIIVASDHVGNTAFLNSVFGFATTLNYGCVSDESVAGSLQPAATGTEFAGGPATVANLSCTSALNSASLPAGAESIYSGTGTSVAFGAEYGAGRVVWLGYDFYGSASTAMHIDDWYLVLDSSILFTGFFTTCSAEGFTGSRLTLCRQICEVPQTATRLTSLIKLYTTAYRAPSPCPSVVARL